MCQQDAIACTQKSHKEDYFVISQVGRFFQTFVLKLSNHKLCTETEGFPIFFLLREVNFLPEVSCFLK